MCSVPSCHGLLSLHEGILACPSAMERLWAGLASFPVRLLGSFLKPEASLRMRQSMGRAWDRRAPGPNEWSVDEGRRKAEGCQADRPICLCSRPGSLCPAGSSPLTSFSLPS